MRLSTLLAALLFLALAAAVAWGLHEKWQEPLLSLFNDPEPPHPFDPAFLRLSAVDIAKLPVAVRFDDPLGSQHAALTYNAQPFRVTRHLGDDLNGIGGQNSDLGDPVYAAGTGRVVFAGDPGPGWGNMLILAHRIPNLDDPSRERVVQTVYAHLEKIIAQPGQIVDRSQQIGTVGTAGGIYLAHLHFEVREGPYINPSVGYADAPLNRLSPEKFLAERRGAAPEQLNPPPVPGSPAAPPTKTR